MCIRDSHYVPSLSLSFSLSLLPPAHPVDEGQAYEEDDEYHEGDEGKRRGIMRRMRTTVTMITTTWRREGTDDIQHEDDEGHDAQYGDGEE
eukprot:3499536-Pyramimonas_sp.AAC.1